MHLVEPDNLIPVLVPEGAVPVTLLAHLGSLSPTFGTKAPQVARAWGGAGAGGGLEGEAEGCRFALLEAFGVLGDVEAVEQRAAPFQPGDRP